MTCNEANERIWEIILNEAPIDLAEHVNSCHNCKEKLQQAKTINLRVDKHFELEKHNINLQNRLKERLHNSRKISWLIPLLSAAAVVVLSFGLYLWVEKSGSKSLEYTLSTGGVVRAEPHSLVHRISDNSFRLEKGNVHVQVRKSEKISIETETATVEILDADQDGLVDFKVSIEEQKGANKMKKITVIMVLAGTLQVTSPFVDSGKITAKGGDTIQIYAKQDKNDQIKGAVKNLSDTDPQVRLEAMRALIDLEAVKELDPLAKSDDAEIKTLAETAIKVLSLFKSAPGLKKIWKKSPKEIEFLAGTEKKDWLDYVNTKVDEEKDFLNSEEKSTLAKEILKDTSIRKWLTGLHMNSYLNNHIKLDDPWFILAILEDSETKMRLAMVTALGCSHNEWAKCKQQEALMKALLKRLDDSSSEVRSYTSWTIGTTLRWVESTMLDEIVKALEAALGKEKTNHKIQIESTLSGIKTKIAKAKETKELETNLRGFIKELESEDVKTQKNAVKKLIDLAKSEWLWNKENQYDSIALKKYHVKKAVYELAKSTKDKQTQNSCDKILKEIIGDATKWIKDGKCPGCKLVSSG